MKTNKGKKIIFAVVCILINIVGKYIGTIIISPFWLDSIGTGLAAYFLGPIWGAGIGLLVDLSYAAITQNPVVGLYGLTAIAIGYTVGICAKRGYIGKMRMMLPVSALIAFVSTIVSLPINCIFFNGMTGNIWGDGIFSMLHSWDVPFIASAFVAEHFLDVVDKVTIVLVLYLVLAITGRMQVDDDLPRVKYAIHRVLAISSILILVAMYFAWMVNGTSNQEHIEIYDFFWFKFLYFLEAIIIVSWTTFFVSRLFMQRQLNLQKRELELAKLQVQMGNETIMAIARTVDARDVNTSNHSIRVSEYSVAIAKQIGYSEEEQENLRKAALLHDIGKIGIPDNILNKPGKLTDEEYATMKTHVLVGGEILKDFSLIPHIQEGAMYHHERYDGKGYCKGLSGENIPEYARIIGIADAFDAMTSNRVYRKKLDMDYVLGEMKKGCGTQFDPRFVKIFLELLEEGVINPMKSLDEAKKDFYEI